VAKSKKPAKKPAAAKKPATKPAAKKPAAKKPAAKPVKAPKAKPAPARKPAPIKEPPIRPVRPGIAVRPLPPPPVVPVVPVRVIPPSPPGELAPARDVGRLLRHGEPFGPHKIEIRHLPVPVVVTSGRIAVADPLTPASGRVLARQVPPGRFRVMISVALIDGAQRIAAAVMHVGRPPIARWVIAHFEGQKPPRTPDQPPACRVDAGAGAFMDALVLDALRAQPDVPEPPVQTAIVPQLTATPTAANTASWIADATSGRNLVAFTSGWGDGTYTSYWALDAAGQPVCLVTDFDVFNKAEWKVPKKK
jgi:hypothetical protein